MSVHKTHNLGIIESTLSVSPHSCYKSHSSAHPGYSKWWFDQTAQRLVQQLRYNKEATEHGAQQSAPLSTALPTDRGWKIHLHVPNALDSMAGKAGLTVRKTKCLLLGLRKLRRKWGCSCVERFSSHCVCLYFSP